MARGQLKFEAEDESVSSDEAAETLAEAFAAFGLRCEDDAVLDEDEFWLWPENEKAFALWCAVQSQWVVGPSGVLGLNYPGVESCMRMRGIGKRKWPALFELIQAMERAALNEWAAQR